MDTDTAWELWGQKDPYFGVLSEPRFRLAGLTEQLRAEFFDSGRHHVRHVLQHFRQHVDPDFKPRRVMDFGCGVGRLVIPFAEVVESVVGVDVAPSMLAQAQSNCAEHGLDNVALVLGDDALSRVDGDFDLVHSTIVLQHVEVARGRVLFGELVRKVRPGGCGLIHVTFGREADAATFGCSPPELPPPPPGPASIAKAWAKRLMRTFLPRGEGGGNSPDQAPRDPEMQMNYYNLSELMFILQREGTRQFEAEFTNHGGALGVILYFQRPAAA